MWEEGGRKVNGNRKRTNSVPLGAYSMTDMLAVGGLNCNLLILCKTLCTLVHSGKILFDNTI